MLRRFLIPLALGMALAMTACAGVETQQQKIAVACESSATALDALTEAKLAGHITQDQLEQAIAVYNTTTPFCQPVATSLGSADYLVLVQSAAQLTAKAGERR